MRNLILAILSILLLTATAALAQPTLGEDCGTGATIVGLDTAGKVTLGTDEWASCTLTFADSHARVCSASDETGGSKGFAFALGTKTTLTTLEMDFMYPPNTGDVISYQCSTF